MTAAAQGTALPGAQVRAEGKLAITDSAGRATLTLPAGGHRITVWAFGYSADTLAVALRAGQDTSVFVELTPVALELAPLVVRSTRGETRVEDEAERVEVLAPEDVQEKALTSPGNTLNLLVEMGGIRVQRAAPGLGGASIRVQGLPGPYTLLLADGLPLYGARAPVFSLAQTPPLDLAQAEVIKGAATALYGPSALGGVVDLISKTPADERRAAISQTTRRGTDALLWLSRAGSGRWGHTVLAGAHHQGRVDVDGDGWADLPGYTRVEGRPRLFWDGPRGSSLMVTVGGTFEERRGGTLPGAALPSGDPFADALDTRHVDVGAVGRISLGPTASVHLRASSMGTWHERTLGSHREHDRRMASFGEASLSLVGSRHSLVLGAAAELDGLRVTPFRDFDRSSTVASLFAQDTYSPGERLSIAASARLDRHDHYGTFVSPRVSALVRVAGGWVVRASAAEGFHASSADADVAQEVGYAHVRPVRYAGAERGRSGSLDLEGPLGPLRLNATFFAVRIAHPVLASPSAGDRTRLSVRSASGPLRSAGVELYAVYAREPFLVTATYSHTRATEPSPEGEGRIRVPLTPRSAGGVDVAWEDDEPGESGLRVAAEVFRTGPQTVEEDPYRGRTPAYTTVDILVSRRVGPFTLFANGENLTDVRQTGWDPLLRGSEGPGGRWTTDEWAPLEGRTVRLGLQVPF